MFSRSVCWVYKPKLYLFFVLFYLLLLPAYAVLPPEYYKHDAEESKIKAIATITKVETISIGKYASFKKATFKLEYELPETSSNIVVKTYTMLRKLTESSTPKVFTGLCSSVDTKEQNKNIMAGGTIYFYPHVGSRVFVTVSEDGGPITTLTNMTPKLEKAIYETPEKLKYGMGNIYISK